MTKITINDADVWSVRAKEAFRMLRTNIEFTGIENKTIVLTSCTPNDGKTTVAYQLARAFSETDKRTLYIDADMRQSVFLRRQGFEEGLTGLSHFLSGHNELREVIYSTNVHDFYVLPTGKFPSNPSELLSKVHFGEMLKELKSKFDYIFIDAPPIGSVIDAAVIAKKCDGSVLVVASDKNSRREELRMVEQMRTANPNILGVVLNKVDASSRSYYGRRYYYPYHQPGPSGKDKEGVGK